MPKDDIFNEYAKIAIKNGILKVAKEDSKPKKTRLDYSDSEAIQALYGVKPDSNSSVEYENNISEYAHPNSVVVSPAHDKINGLFENNNERHNIIVNIVNDPANGHLNQRKYAKSELIGSLVRVANDMDNKDQEGLRILADKCIENVNGSNSVNKVAFDFSNLTNKDWWSSLLSDVGDTGAGAMTGYLQGGIGVAIVGGVLGAFVGGPAGALGGMRVGFSLGSRLGGLLGGVTAAISNTGPSAQNTKLNAKDSIKQVDDLIERFPENGFLISLKKSLENLVSKSERYSQLISGTSASEQEVEQITKKYLRSMERVQRKIPIFKSFKDAGEFQTDSLVDKVRSSFSNFVGTNAEDVEKSLNQLNLVIEKAKKSMVQLRTAVREFAQDAKEAAEDASEEAAEKTNNNQPKPTEVKPANNPSTNPPQNPETDKPKPLPVS